MTLEAATTELETMQSDPMFITESIYSPTAFDFPDRILPFVQVHLTYLRKHKQVDPAGYISNLKIMIKRRS
jgi:hypothetical protein